MAKPRPFFSLANEEIARLKSFEEFMRGRVELEQYTISGLEALLVEAPPLPDRKLLWHHALEKLLDGTRDEIHTRTEELEGLKDQMKVVGMSIANAEKYIRDLSFEAEKLESTMPVRYGQEAAAAWHKDWLYIKSVDVNVPKNLSNLFSSGQAQKEKLEKLEHVKSLQSNEAFLRYYVRDLNYRRIVHQQRQGQKQFLNSILDRVQEYGTKYWSAVCDVGMVMESFANYLRNTSSACNSSGSAIWASAKNIRPLVDANCHMEAIEFSYHRSPIRFSPIHYRNPGSDSRSPNGQTILFGCPLELCTVGELTRLPPVLEYLLDSVHAWPTPYPGSHSMEKYWPLANEIEQAWAGVEERDRAIISKLVPQDDHRSLIMGYLMALPEPIWSEDDIIVAGEVTRNPSSLMWKTWSKDSTKLAVLRAMVSCHDRLDPDDYFIFGSDMVQALSQKQLDLDIADVLMYLWRCPDFRSSPVNNVPVAT